MNPINFNNVWKQLLHAILHNGTEVRPRNRLTLELLHKCIIVDTRCPVLTLPDRKLSYKFMAAEAHWILTGDNRVSTIAPFNERIADFSDDGRTFFGAYGPPVVGQLPYVINKLVVDRDSRQAGLTIWRQNPPETKDVPCTITIFFGIRGGKLHSHVFMRSSDAWLGIPYDVFNFSMITHFVCAKLNKDYFLGVEPGLLYLTAASSHLYETNFEAARECVNVDYNFESQSTPDVMFKEPTHLITRLRDLRWTKPGNPLRWWELAPDLGVEPEPTT